MLKALRRACLLAAAGVIACSGGGGGGSGAPPAPSGNPGGIPTTANSIDFSTGAGRSDPEGVAPPATSTSVLTWKDSRGADRTMTLGAYLYQYDFSFDDGNGNVVTRSANDNAFGHPGFGYVVSHNTQTGNSPLGKVNLPSDVTTTIFAGAHHAIHHIELLYDRDKEPDGMGIKIPVVIEWLVATGRDHPVWSVTWKTGAATNPGAIDFNAYRMDTRGPYGSLSFDGATGVYPTAGDDISGVAWGDFDLKFTTTNAQVTVMTLNSPWDYSAPNTVNFTQAWTTSATNAEMGIVQTKPGDNQLGYPDRVVGRERNSTSAAAYLDKGDCNGFGDSRVYAMPCVAGWSYQMMNFDWDPASGKPLNEATGTKLMAWGSPYGWLGATDADLFDFSGTADATGDRSYATFIVLGPHCRFTGPTCPLDGDVAITIKAVEALGVATIGAVGPGTLVTQVPRGPGATDKKTLINGYNDTYAAYYLSATANQVAFTFTPALGKPVKSPMFVIQNWTLAEIPVLSVGGTPVTVNDGTATSGAFVSFNQTTNELWITLNRTLSAATDISVSP